METLLCKAQCACQHSIAQTSHTITQRQPASIVHRMIFHSGLKRSTCPSCDFNYGPIVRNMKTTLFPPFSSLTIRPVASCLRKWLLCSALFLYQQSERVSAPLKALRCGGSRNTRPSCIQEKREISYVTLTQSRGQQEARQFFCAPAFGS